MSKYVIGIVGATGVVGTELLSLLDERGFPVKALKLFASQRSVGKHISFKEKIYPVETPNKESLCKCDIVFGCANNNISRQIAKMLQESPSIYIDNSSAFRYEQNIPLVIPEINSELLSDGAKIIANPNCTAIILAVALWPIQKRFNIKRTVVSTYQAVSGAGHEAMKELEKQVIQYSKNETLTTNIFPEQILFNVQSHNSAILENGFNGEENKVMIEVKKIFRCPNLNISVTCMRVPVMRAHMESVYFEVEKECSLKQILVLLKNAPGIKIVNDSKTNNFPTSLKASNQDSVLVGRAREDLYSPLGFHLLVAGDQLRKGAALNALQIAEKIIEKS